MKCAAFLIALTMLCGCSEKKLKHAKIPATPGVSVQFQGIKDGKCEIADVFLNAKTKGYTVVCK